MACLVVEASADEQDVYPSEGVRTGLAFANNLLHPRAKEDQFINVDADLGRKIEEPEWSLLFKRQCGEICLEGGRVVEREGSHRLDRIVCSSETAWT